MSFLLSACPEAPSHVGTSLDLTRPATAPAARIPLASLPLKTQADFDDFEDRYLAQRDPAALLDVLERLAAFANPAERPEDALLLMRLAVLYRDNDDAARRATGTGYLQKALTLGNRLRETAPRSPHTLYLQGYIPYAFMGGTTARPLVITPDARDFITACRDQWRLLLEVAPDYDGPHEFDHARIRASVDAIDQAIAQLDAPPTTLSGAVSGTPMSLAALAALNQRARFEAATDGDRKPMCRDWDAGRAAAKADAPRSPEELDLDLECATLLGKIDVAVPLIARLRDATGPAFAPCLAVAKLRDRSPSAALERLLSSAAFDCK